MEKTISHRLTTHSYLVGPQGTLGAEHFWPSVLESDWNFLALPLAPSVGKCKHLLPTGNASRQIICLPFPSQFGVENTEIILVEHKQGYNSGARQPLRMRESSPNGSFSINSLYTVQAFCPACAFLIWGKINNLSESEHLEAECTWLCYQP